MKSQSSQPRVPVLLALLLACLLPAFAQEPKAEEKPAPAPAAPAAPEAVPAASEPAPAPPAPPAPGTGAAPAEPAAAAEKEGLRRLDEVEKNERDSRPRGARRWDHDGHGAPRIAVGNDVRVPAGERVEAAVAVLGSTTVEGEVNEAAVSVLGNTRATGPVGQAAVAVIGNTYVNSKVGESVVAVLGDVELGPRAEVGGDVVAVGGQVHRDPEAIVHGSVQNVAFFHGVPNDAFAGLREWFRRCVMLGRPLAFGHYLGWAWSIAIGFWVFYVLLALLFRRGIERCVATLETRPGATIVTSFLTILLSPVLLVLLCVTIVGVAVVPFFALGLFIATLFGKAVLLAWMGRPVTRLFGEGPLSHPVFGVVLGGAFVLLLYTVPVLGIIVYKLLGVLGLGVVVATIVQSSRREKPVAAVPPAPVPIPTPVGAAPSPASVASGTFEAPGAMSAGFGAPPAPGPIPAASLPPITPAVASTLPRAGFWIRMGALALDVILVGMVTGFMTNLVPRFVRPEGPPALLLALAVYGAVMWKMKGTTIGGIICGLRVVRVDGRELDWATAVVRALGCFLSLIVAGLGFIWVVIDDERQSWHDKIAGTAVVRAPKGSALL